MVEKAYYKRLDYIRIASCILVLLYHLNIIKGGFFAVCTFFVLSGYLSCASALKTNNFSIKKYYISRIKKVYIPLIIVVFLTVIFIKLNNINFLNLKRETLSVLFGYNNFWQLDANLDYFARHINSPFMHLWYISILMQFELIFPLIFKILKKIGKNISTIIVFILMAASIFIFYYACKNKDIMVVYYNTFFRSFSLLIGVFLALITHNYIPKLPKILEKSSKFIFTLYMAFLILICVLDNSKEYALSMICISIISARLIRYSTIISTKKNKFISLLSNITYEIYLVQYPVIYFMQKFKINNYLKVSLIIIITFVVSYIIYVLIRKKTKNVFLKVIRVLLISLVIIFGSILLIKEKDHTAEMKELENKLNENLKQMDAKKKENLKKIEEEEKEWNATLENIKNEESKIAQMVHNLPVIGIGDSVLLGASDGLYKVFPNGYFDGKVSRTILGSEDLLKSLKSEGKLGDYLILALANNGDYRDYINQGLMEIVGDRKIYWVDAVNADDPTFNEKFEAFASNYPNIHIVKWEQASSSHPEYFYADGIHLKGPGVEAYANVIYNAIYEDYLKEHSSKTDEIIKNHEKSKEEKIIFYGNDILTNSFSLISEKFNKASFNAKKYTFNSLYDEVKSNELDSKIVFMFDNKLKITKSQYEKLISLCNNHKIYILNMNKELSFDNEFVKVIDFYDKINKNKDYIMSDKIHLTKKGNKELVKLLVEKIK